MATEVKFIKKHYSWKPGDVKTFSDGIAKVLISVKVAEKNIAPAAAPIKPLTEFKLSPPTKPAQKTAVEKPAVKKPAAKPGKKKAQSDEVDAKTKKEQIKPAATTTAKK